MRHRIAVLAAFTLGLVIVDTGLPSDTAAATSPDPPPPVPADPPKPPPRKCAGKGCLEDSAAVTGDGGGNDQTTTAAQHHAAYCSDPLVNMLLKVPKNDFRTAADSSITAPRAVVNVSETFRGGGTSRAAVETGPIVVPDIAVEQRFTFSCAGQREPGKWVEENKADFWVPLITPDSVAYRAGLFAKVHGRLTMPTVTWSDIDKDHDWLWVRYEHHLRIAPPAPVSESANDASPITGQSANAWVKATPIEFTLDLPRDTGIKSSQLTNCDLAKATSKDGCAIRFTHASSITDDGWFEGTATITWAVSSNSGKYNGKGPFMTTTGFRIQVAELMAVSQPNGEKPDSG